MKPYYITEIFKNLEPGTEKHIFKLNTQKVEVVGSEFKASLGYINMS